MITTIKIETPTSNKTTASIIRGLGHALPSSPINPLLALIVAVTLPSKSIGSSKEEGKEKDQLRRMLSFLLG